MLAIFRCKSVRQHGFANEKSCTTQMLPFTNDIAVNLNKREKADTIYFDFAKAFDSVSHDIILQKLKNKYKVNDSHSKLGQNWLFWPYFLRFGLQICFAHHLH